MPRLSSATKSASGPSSTTGIKKKKTSSSSSSSASKKMKQPAAAAKKKKPAPASAKARVISHTDDGTPIVNATMAQIRKGVGKAAHQLVRVPQVDERSKLYAEAARAIGERESLALPYHGGRMWKCLVRVSDDNGARGDNFTAEGMTSVKFATAAAGAQNDGGDDDDDDNEKATKKKKKTNYYSQTPLFRWYRGSLILATLTYILEDIIEVRNRQCGKKRWANGLSDDEGLDSSDEEWDDGRYVVTPTTKVVTEASVLTTSAYEDTSHPMPRVVRSWTSPDLQRFTTRKSALAHAEQLIQRDLLVDKVLYGYGSHGVRLRPVKPTRKMALEAGIIRFWRDGLWVVGQEEAWVEKRREILVKKQERRSSQQQLLHQEEGSVDDVEDGRGVQTVDAMKIEGEGQSSDEVKKEEDDKMRAKVFCGEDDISASVELSAATISPVLNFPSTTSSGTAATGGGKRVKLSDEERKQKRRERDRRRRELKRGVISSSSTNSDNNTNNNNSYGTASTTPPPAAAAAEASTVGKQLELTTDLTLFQVDQAVSEIVGPDPSPVVPPVAEPAEPYVQPSSQGTVAGVSSRGRVRKMSQAMAESSQQGSVVMSGSLVFSDATIAAVVSAAVAEIVQSIIQANTNSSSVHLQLDATDNLRTVDGPKPDWESNAKIISPVESDASTEGTSKSDVVVPRKASAKPGTKPPPEFVPSTHYRLNQEQIARCFTACVDHYEKVMHTVKARSLYHELADGFDVFRERGRGRYDMELSLFDTPEFAFLTDMRSAAWMPIVHKILGEDALLVHKGCFMSLPGAESQVYHQDGVHLNQKVHKPCYAINVFIPLVDYNHANGPTEFCLGSHYLGHENFVKENVYIPIVKAGTPVIFDYRLGHRGLRNFSDSVRPVVYLTYSSVASGKEFRDSVNFSRKRYRKLGDFVEAPISRDERRKKRRMEETVALTTAPSTVAPSTATISAAASPIIPSPALFQVGTVVDVLDRTWIGRNDQGGVARIIKVRPNGEDGDNDGCTKYDVKYVLETRQEKFIEERFLTLHAE